MSQPMAALKLQPEDVAALKKTSRATSLPLREVLRAKVLLAAADGLPNSQIARRFGVSINSVKRWRSLYATQRLDGFAQVAPGRGRKPTITDEQTRNVLTWTTNEAPPCQNHWSCRTMAARAGISPAAVQRIWASHGVNPHSVDTFHAIDGRGLEIRLIDIAGLFMAPRERAVVLRLAPLPAGAPEPPSPPAPSPADDHLTHEWQPKCPVCLLTALNSATGGASGLPKQKHDTPEYMHFLDDVAKGIPPDSTAHIVMDNCGTFAQLGVVAWLGAHPQFATRITPTLTGWLGLVAQCLRLLDARGLPAEDVELESAISHFLDSGEHPKPFVWTIAGMLN